MHGFFEIVCAPAKNGSHAIWLLYSNVTIVDIATRVYSMFIDEVLPHRESEKSSL